VFEINGFRVIGYSGELLLPIELTPADPSGRVAVAARVDLGVCEDVCIPASISFSADLPSGGSPDPAIRAALDERPMQKREAARCAVEPIADGMRVTATTDVASPGPGEFAVIELAGSEVWVSRAEAKRTSGTLTAVAELVPPEAKPFAVDRSDIRITLFGGGEAVEIVGCTG
jgi:DsbC/DsbD-like thiol-disulfide interchange protein